VGVWSSISAGPWLCLGCAMPAAQLQTVAAPMRPPAQPMTAATSTMSGKGSCNAKMATNDAAAIAHSAPFFSAREPMRWAACTTMAVTAGLMP